MVNIGTRCMAVYLAEHCTGLFCRRRGRCALHPCKGLTRAQVKHLASRAGFGATQAETDALIGRSAAQALAYFSGNAADASEAVFQHSGIFDPGLDPFPPSRPATTELAKRQGHALGIEVKPGGNRPLQPIVNTFFYWLRASRLETDRVAYWWANRMLSSKRPLQEKAALFWHGHFATNETRFATIARCCCRSKHSNATDSATFEIC